MPTLESTRARLHVPGASRHRALLASLLSTREIGWIEGRVPGWCGVLLAASPAGVSQLLLATSESEAAGAVARLVAPRGVTLRPEPGLRPLLDEVASWLASPSEDLPLPIDVEGTSFQSDVWRALFSVPAGQTASYADIAHRIGRPRAVRAVGQAVGANPVSLAIPCHRVIAADGRLGGYGWGPELKRRLLGAERDACRA